MKLPGTRDDRLRWAGLAIATGLLIELLTIFWIHPFSFMLFSGPGLLLIGAGVVLYFYTAATEPR